MLARWRASLVILLAAAPALVVLAGLVGAWLTPAGDALQHQWRYLLPDASRNTLILVTVVAIGSVLLGTTLAALVALCDFPGRRFFSWGLLLPLSIPGYVLAKPALQLAARRDRLAVAIDSITRWRGPRTHAHAFSLCLSDRAGRL